MKNFIFSDALDIQKIKQATKHRGEIYHFESINSTSSWLQQNGHCGDICISDTQTAGRGRRGNQWVSPQTGNIYFSLVWCFNKPMQDIKHFSLLGLVVGIAMAEALADVNLKNHGVKWPNDIFWQQRKMGGILIESTNKPSAEESNKVIIGIGLNINMPDVEERKIDQDICSLAQALSTQMLPAQSDEDLTHKKATRNQLIIAMIQHLKHHLSEFSTLEFDVFERQWEKWDILKNNLVSFKHQNTEVSGTVVKLDQHGRLGVIDNNGSLKFYSSADIKLRRD